MGRRRTGCLTCRRRKIKCDERRPTCLHCETSTRECVDWASPFQPEYQPVSHALGHALPCSALKFKKPLSNSPKKHRNQRRKGDKRVLSRGSSPRLIDANRDTVPGSSHGSTEGGAIYKPRILAAVATSPAERLAGRVVDLIQNGSTHRFNVLYFGAYFQELPVFLGTSLCLDSAVECFLLVQQRLSTPRSLACNRLLQQYGKALKVLQVELETLKPCKRTETLAAAVILLVSEIIDDSLSIRSRLIHAEGACALLRACGPGGFNSKFELQLFYSLVPIIVSSCLEQNTECFLCTPEWMSILGKIPSQWTATRIEARILHTYTQMPSFMQAVRKWRHSPVVEMPEYLLMGILDLKQQLIQLGKETADTLQTSGLMLEVPCESRRPGPSSYYLFRDVRLADGLSIFFRMVILMARGLSQLHLLQASDREWASLASMQLCMSVEHRQSNTPIEAFFEALILRVARLACPYDLGDWIDNRLQQVDVWMDSSLKNLVYRFETWLDIEGVVSPGF